MSDDRWQRVSNLFAEALARDTPARIRLLEAVADRELRQEVESLLAAHDASGPFDRLAGQMAELRRGALGSWTAASGSGDAGDAAPALQTGHRLGRHEIRQRLGAGGAGEVYRALDTRLEREVAIKILRRRAWRRPGSLQRFEQEARAASSLNHPNIVTVHDIGEEDAFPYIVMELVEGSSLRQMLASPWPPELLLHLAVQIADGLVAAHERQMVHGDLKPENVLVSRQGVAKIVDFGLARFLLEGDGAEEMPASPTTTWPSAGLLGTPGYLAPEVVSGGATDLRSDQFSLGVILHEMATGTDAFAGRTNLEILMRTVASELPDLAEVRPDLPAGLARAIARCLSKDPGQRYGTTRELLAELRAARRVPVPAAEPRRGPVSLPAPRTRLIGRQRELEEIERLVVEQQVRLLTLTGPGGTGKTRLALTAAERLAPGFGGGTFFVSLAAITDPALVVPLVAQALGVAAAGRPSLSAVIEHLRGAGAPALLVLDNFEQVIDAAAQLSELLAGCPDLTVLVTSRQVLRLYGEHGFPVAALALPDPTRLPPLERLAEFAAVALFVERAQAANPAFALTADNAGAVAALCAGLDGLPLALELAAAQSRVCGPDQMLARLENRLGLLTGGARDLPDRQQTLRRTLDWSHQLLAPGEQAVFRRLGVFAGGFTLEAAQAVVDPFDKLGFPVDEAVAALVDKSLVQPSEIDGERRFSMLETLRAYALEKLAASGEGEAASRAHAAYLLVLAEEGPAAFVSAERPRWLRRFEREHDNFRAALEWLTRGRHAEWGLRLAVALFHFWERGEHLAEGRRRLTELLEMEEAAAVPRERARAMFMASVLASDQGDFDGAIPLGVRSLETYRALGDRRGMVVALVALGNQHLARRDAEQARQLFEESLEIWEEIGDQGGFARSLSNLASVAREQGRFDEARALYRRAAGMFERAGDLLGHAWTSNHEGDVAREQDDLPAAESLYRAALAIFRSLADSWGTASSLADLGAIARQRGDRPGAHDLYRQALTGFVQLDHGRGVARVLECLACLAGEEGQPERGLKLAATAAALRRRVGVGQPPASARDELTRSVSAMHRALGPESARRLWQEGAALSVEEAVRLAADQ